METKNIMWPGWETVKLIGRGSFGAVYEIERNVFGNVEKAALKVISIPQNEGDLESLYEDGFDEESITATFQSHLKSIVAEYSLMKKMSDCVNIVSCDDMRYVQHDDGIGWDIFIKMELLTPLTKVFSAEPTEEDVTKIAKDMCAALIACKESGIVHRDIKPQNIFRSTRGDYKLGDFGIAKTVEKTMGGTKIGTYKYMAPEVYNNQPYGTSADIYSLGLVLYWLLNERRMPFAPLPPEKVTISMDEQARMRRLSGEQIPAPIHGTENLKKIVLKACAYDPKERYTSAAQMLRELSDGFGSETLYRKKEEESLRKEQEEKLRKECEAQERLRKEREEQERLIREQEKQAQKAKEEQERIRKEQIRTEQLRRQKEEQAKQQKQMAEEAERRRLQNREERLRREAEEKKRARDRRPYYIFAGIAVLAIVVLLAAPRQKLLNSNSTMPNTSVNAKQKETNKQGLKNAKNSGWQTIDGDAYYYDENGDMVTGGIKIDGNWYVFDNDGRFQYCDVWKTVSATQSEDDVSVVMSQGYYSRGGYRVLTEPAENVTTIRVNVYGVRTENGNINGKWQLYVRTLDGNWKWIEYYQVTDGEGYLEIEFDDPISFDAYRCAPYTVPDGSFWHGSDMEIGYRSYDWWND